MFSLSSLDAAWNNSLAESQVVKIFSTSINWLNGIFSNSKLIVHIGELLQSISIYLSALLFICLSLSQFANDKMGLAVILLASFFCWFSGKLLSAKLKLRGNFVDALVLLFFFINIIATFSSHYFAASLHGLAKLSVYILTYFLFCSQFKDRPQNQFTFASILLFSGIVLSLYGLYQYKIGVAPLATWEDPNIENQATRIYATFNNPNLFAGFLLPITMLSAAFVFANWNLSKWFISILAILITALLTIALILTGSRGAYLGMFVGYASLFVVGLAKIWQLKTKQRFILPVLLLLVPIGIFAIFHYMPGFEHRIASIFAGREHSSNSFRLNVWLSSLAMFKDNWLIGVGVGNQAFCLAYGLYMRSGFDALGTYCVPLEIAVESGVLGLLTFSLIIVGLFYRAHLIFWAERDLSLYRKWLIVGSTVGLISLLAHGLVDTVFFRPQIQFIFYFFVSLIIANTDFTNQNLERSATTGDMTT